MRLAPLFLPLALAVILAPLAAPAQPVETCIKSWGEARFGALAYNHIVHIENRCAAEAQCVVSTDVNPEPQTARVPGKSAVEVLTFMGSPARTFTPHVTCKMGGNP